MKKRKVNIGDKYGMLTVIRKEPSGKYCSWWYCKCECGQYKKISGSNLLSGQTVSCGCKRKKARIKHGFSNSRLYHIWANMLQRCNNPNKPDYKYYGGRGITVCDEWKTFEGFNKWVESTNYSDKLTIDRIDVNKGYSPENCRWVTLKTQFNNRRSNVKITIDGITKTATEWGDITGENSRTITERIRKGFNPEKAIQNVDYRKC